jgi:hypothetical protein
METPKLLIRACSWWVESRESDEEVELSMQHLEHSGILERLRILFLDSLLWSLYCKNEF